MRRSFLHLNSSLARRRRRTAAFFADEVRQTAAERLAGGGELRRILGRSLSPVRQPKEEEEANEAPANKKKAMLHDERKPRRSLSLTFEPVHPSWCVSAAGGCRWLQTYNNNNICHMP